MSDLMVQIIDCETGEEIVREMTADEIKQRDKDLADSAKTKLEAENLKAAKEALLKAKQKLN